MYALGFGGNQGNTASLFTTATSNITFSVWVNWNGLFQSSYQAFFHNGDPTQSGYGLGIQGGNTGVVQVCILFHE